jgi:hypothetical protein
MFQAGYTSDGRLEVVVVDIYIDGGSTYSCKTMMNEVVVHMDHGGCYIQGVGLGKVVREVR